METIQMKRFCSLWIMMLLAIPVSGMAQTTEKTPQQTATPTPPPTPAKSAPPATSGPAVGNSVSFANTANYAGPMDASRYIIGPEDSLQVTVWKEPTLSGNFPVRPDGMISLVLVGDLPAAGHSLTILASG
jgi:polysaccharide export outer membrane protein